MSKILKLLFFVVTGALFIVACDKYDDSDIWDKVNSLDKRVSSLESLVEKMNGNITSLQTIVTKLQATVSISNVKETSTGYTISFTDGSSINLYHGEKGEKGDKGENGTNGTNGSNGKNGSDGKDAPIIGVALYGGIYYWTLTTNGTTSWLTDDNGNKIPVTGPKGDKGDTGSGEKGDKGDNAPTPILKVDSDGYWLISYNSGATFGYVLDANGNKVSALGYQGEKGEKGDKGEQGDAFFKSLVEGEDFVYLTLANDTIITIPKYRGFSISFSTGSEATVTGGESITVTYTLSYGTDKSCVVVFPANGWKAEVSRESNSGGKITLMAPAIDCEGETVILATDGNGQSTTAAIVCKATSTGNYIYVADKMFNVSSSGADLQIEVQTTVDYTVEIPYSDRSWIALEEVVTKASLREDVVKLKIAENGTPFDRTSTIEIVNKGGTTIETFVISQTKGVTENMIVYTSVDGNIVTPYNTRAFGTGINIVSNTVSNGKGVISFSGKIAKIGDNAFANCTGLNTIELPESVTEIGTSAFTGCTALAEVVFNDNLKVIGSYAFNNCTSFGDLYLPDSVEEIGEFAFSGTTLKTITIGTGLKEIKASMFEGQSALRSVILSEGLVSVGDNAFKGCTSLKSMLFPESVSELGYSVLRGCSTLNSVTIGGKLLNIPESFCAELTSLSSIKLREGVEIIGDKAFDGCTNIASIDIPNTVTVIGSYSYRNCSSVSSIKLGNNIREIKNDAFNGCSSFKAIAFPSRIERIGDRAFAGCKSITTLSIPESVIYIGDQAFINNTSLVSVCVNNGDIGYGCFVGCTNLSDLTIYNGSIGNYAFMNLTQLSNVTFGGNNLGDGVSRIGNYAFWGCTKVSKVLIPDSVSYVGESAFKDCSNLFSVVVGNNVLSLNDETFSGCTSLYEITLGEKLERIEKLVFINCRNLRRIEIPSSVKYIGFEAFKYIYIYGQSHILEVFLKPVTPPAHDGRIFEECDIVKLYVPRASESAYIAFKNEGISRYTTLSVIPYDFD